MDTRDYNMKLECTDCPLCDAPGCFRRALIRALELGSSNYLPTNWRGFAEHFSIGVPASSPEELVDIWADKHPNRKQHTIRKVLEYAEAKQHNALLQDFNEILKGEVIFFFLVCIISSKVTAPQDAHVSLGLQVSFGSNTSMQGNNLFGQANMFLILYYPVIRDGSRSYNVITFGHVDQRNFHQTLLVYS